MIFNKMVFRTYGTAAEAFITDLPSHPPLTRRLGQSTRNLESCLQSSRSLQAVALNLRRRSRANTHWPWVPDTPSYASRQRESIRQLEDLGTKLPSKLVLIQVISHSSYMHSNNTYQYEIRPTYQILQHLYRAREVNSYKVQYHICRLFDETPMLDRACTRGSDQTARQLVSR